MKDQMKLGVVAVVMFVAGVSLGATNTPNEYDRACQNFMAEAEAARFISGQAVGIGLKGGGDRAVNELESRNKANRNRLRHWLSIMEQFKP